MVTYANILDAHKRIEHLINRTPVFTSTTLNKLSGRNIFFKCENFQKVGAFKYRGVSNTISLLLSEARERGVIAHSSGNHAQAIAKACQEFGVKATVVMPKNAPKVKIDATADTYRANVVFCDSNIQSRQETADALISQHGYVFIHPYDNENIIAGAGTAAYELLNDYPFLDAIIAPIGGGGLLSGTSIAARGFKDDIAVFGAEPELVDDAYRSMISGRIETNTTTNTIADGLRTNLSPLTFNIIRKNVDNIITVSEKMIIDAMQLVWQRMKILIEPSSAVALAAVLSDRFPQKIKDVGVIISGGNVDFGSFFY